MSTAQPFVNFSTYIHKVLKQVHQDSGLTTDAKMQVNSFINTVGEAITDEAAFLTKGLPHLKKSKRQGKKTLSSREIQTAARIVLRGELAKHAVSEGTKAVTKFMSGGLRGKAQAAGLQFPPARAQKLIKDAWPGRVGSGASVYLAAVLEYLCAELLELAGNAARGNKRKYITPRHLFLSIANDEELNRLTQSLRWAILGGGVLPNIHSVLLPKRRFQ